MADTHVLFALRRKYAERLGAGDQEAVAHLAPVIRMFSPGEDLSAIKPLRPYTNLRGVKGTLWHKLALDVLRTANGPMGAGEIARQIASARGIADHRTLASIESAIMLSFRRWDGEVVEATGVHPRRWALIG
jgi:hypothetical protein